MLKDFICTTYCTSSTTTNSCITTGQFTNQLRATRSWACIHPAYTQCTWRAQPASRAEKKIKMCTPSICFSSFSSISSSTPHPLHRLFLPVSCSASLTHPNLHHNHWCCGMDKETTTAGSAYLPRTTPPELTNNTPFAYPRPPQPL